MFNEWLKWFGRKLRGENRTIILLLDSALVHKSFSGNERTKIRFLLPNTTSALQSCDAGIIHSFKSHYRKLFVRHKLRLLEERLENHNDLRNITLNMQSITCSTHGTTLIETQLETAG